MKIIGEQTKERAVTYGLGAIGLIKGLVVVYAIDPLSDLLREQLRSRDHSTEHQTTAAEAVSIGRAALQQEQQAA